MGLGIPEISQFGPIPTIMKDHQWYNIESNKVDNSGNYQK